VARLTALVTLYAAALGGGTAAFAHLCGLPPLDALYLAVVASSTVGYGDVAPRTPAARAFAVAWLLVGAVGLAKAVAVASEVWGRAAARRAAARLLAAPMGVADVRALDLYGDGRVSWEEYLYLMLVRMGRVSRGELDAIRGAFDAHDRSETGTIDYADVV